MKRAGTVFVLLGVASGALCSLVLRAQSGPESGPVSIVGKFVDIQTSAKGRMICKTTGVQEIGGRQFLVCDNAEKNDSNFRLLIPVDTVTTLRVYETFEAATGNKQATVAASKGVVTRRGKPLLTKLRLHDSGGAVVVVATDEQGRYEIRSLPPGAYTVTFDDTQVPTKYQSVNDTPIKVELRAGENQIDIEVQ